MKETSENSRLKNLGSFHSMKEIGDNSRLKNLGSFHSKNRVAAVRNGQDLGVQSQE